MDLKTKRVVFVRVGWMDYYGYRDDGTIPVGGGSHNKDAEGGESSNFFFHEDGYNLGYVYINAKEPAFNLPRIGGEDAIGKDEIDEVLVIAVATDPRGGGQVIVGWHENAICFGRYQRAPRGHVFTSNIEDSVLLPPEERNCSILRGKGGFGQHNVCYTLAGDLTQKKESWVEEACAFVANYTGRSLLTSVGIEDHEVRREEPSVAEEVSTEKPFVPPTNALDVAERRDANDWFVDGESISLLDPFELADAVNSNPQQIRLPSFQRDSVWDWDHIELLWDSILRGYPLGTLLFARSHPELSGVRELRRFRESSVTKTDDATDDTSLILLDGQQRASAISIGLKKWSPSDESRLWLDLAPRKVRDERLGFHLCSITLPWGPEVTVAQRKAALALLAVEGLPKGSEALGLTWPARARVPVPFAELLELTRAGRFDRWRELVPKPLRDRIGDVTARAEEEWYEALSGTRTYRVPAILMGDMPRAEDLGRTFKRLNTAGVDMTQEELFFSGIKLLWPEAHDLVWNIYSDERTGRFLSPTKIVHAAVRLSETADEKSGGDVPKMNLKVFRSRVEEGDKAEFIRRLAAYLEPKEKLASGRLCETLRAAKDALVYHPEFGEKDPGFPLPLLASLHWSVWHVLAGWIDLNGEVDDTSRLEMLRFAALIHFFSRTPRDNRVGQLFSRARERSDLFPGFGLREVLREKKERDAFLDVLSPKKFENSLTDPESGEPVGWVLYKELDLVMWAQRAYVNQWYSEYDPTLYTGRAAEKPYDIDHIVPKSHFDKRHSGKIKQARGFDEVRHNLMNCPGNYRIWPSSENRSDQDVSPWDKGMLGERKTVLPKESPLRGEPYNLRTCGDVRKASGLQEKDLELWRGASPKNKKDFDWRSPARLDAFLNAVQSRRVRMYKSLYRCLAMGKWRL